MMLVEPTFACTTFLQVLLAAYRGTNVAVKHALPKAQVLQPSAASRMFSPDSPNKLPSFQNQNMVVVMADVPYSTSTRSLDSQSPRKGVGHHRISARHRRRSGKNATTSSDGEEAIEMARCSAEATAAGTEQGSSSESAVRKAYSRDHRLHSSVAKRTMHISECGYGPFWFL